VPLLSPNFVFDVFCDNVRATDASSEDNVYGATGMLEGQVVLGAVQCRGGAQDLRDVRHCIVSADALLACDFLILELSVAVRPIIVEAHISSHQCVRANCSRVKRVETPMLCNT
jgi:hypothetical protein